MDSLTACPFQQIVDAGHYQKFVAVFLQMDEALVGVHHLFQVDVLFHDVSERIFRIVFFVHFDNLFQLYLCLYHEGGEDAAREITAIRNEINLRIKAVLQLLERLLDFRHMLVGKRLVDAEVVVARWANGL